jgi:hypothetical protein
MAHPIGLDGLKPLEVKERLKETVAGGITVKDRHDIGPCRVAKIRIRQIRLIRHLTKQLFGHFTRRQLLRQPVGQRAFQLRMVQDAGMEHAAKKRLFRDGGGRLLRDPLPDRIDLGKL